MFASVVNAFLWGLIGFLLLSLFEIARRKKKEATNFYKPDVTVVVAVWNEGPRIRQAVESILAQDYPKDRFKILVIGGGEDSTAGVCKQLEREKKITYIHEPERRGKWAALNDALEKVKTEAVAFVDGDSVVSKNWLTDLAKYYEDADIISGPIYTPTLRTTISKMFNNYCILADALVPTMLKLWGATIFIGQNSLVKTRVFDKVRFRQSLVEDLRFCFEAQKKGFKVKRIQEAETYPAVAASLHDLHVEFLRALGGLYSEMLREKSVASYMALLLTILSMTLAPILLYYLAVFDVLTWVTTLVLVASLVLVYFALGVKSGRPTLRYIHLLLPVFAFFAWVGTESLLKLLFKKKITWPTLNKILN